MFEKSILFHEERYRLSSDNSIGNEGAIKIAEALKFNTTLTSLFLTGEEYLPFLFKEGFILFVERK